MQFESDRLEHGGHHVAGGDVDRVDQAHHDQDIPALDGRRRPERGIEMASMLKI